MGKSNILIIVLIGLLVLSGTGLLSFANFGRWTVSNTVDKQILASGELLGVNTDITYQFPTKDREMGFVYYYVDGILVGVKTHYLLSLTDDLQVEQIDMSVGTGGLVEGWHKLDVVFVSTDFVSEKLTSYSLTCDDQRYYVGGIFNQVWYESARLYELAGCGYAKEVSSMNLYNGGTIFNSPTIPQTHSGDYSEGFKNGGKYLKDTFDFCIGTCEPLTVVQEKIINKETIIDREVVVVQGFWDWLKAFFAGLGFGL